MAFILSQFGLCYRRGIFTNMFLIIVFSLMIAWTPKPYGNNEYNNIVLTLERLGRFTKSTYTFSIALTISSFWMRFSQAPLCRCRFKVIFDDIIFLLSGNIIEYICFWRFNSIIMTWNKWLVFTKSVIMGLNNISPWPCPLGVVCLPCVITWLYSTPLPSCEPLV